MFCGGFTRRGAISIDRLGCYKANWDAANRPELVARIDQIGVGTPATEGNPDIARFSAGDKLASIVVIVSITNTGAPSIANTWWLVAKTADGQKEYVGMPWVTKANLVNRAGDSINSGATETLGRNSYLPDKTATDPIPRNGARVGYLLFLFKGVDANELKRPGTKMTVKFKDVLGNEITATHVMKQSFGEPLYIPGIER